MDNSRLAPHNGYPVNQQGMCQVALSPSNQPQVHLLPVNPPGLKLPGSEQPVQRAFMEAKTLGVSEILLCKDRSLAGNRWGLGVGGCLEIQKLQIQQAGLELTQAC